MALGQILAGNFILAEDIQDELDALADDIATITARLPLRARQTADVPKTNNTFANLTGMVVALGASKVYRFRGRIVANGSNTTHDLKLQFSLPAGATIEWSSYAGNTAITANPMSIDTGTATTTHARGTVAGTLTYPIEGIITTSGTAGNAQLQGAQNTTDPGTLTFLTGSTMSFEEWV